MTTLAVREGQELTTAEWTPEELQQQIDREKVLREKVIAYYRSQMKDGHH